MTKSPEERRVLIICGITLLTAISATAVWITFDTVKHEKFLETSCYGSEIPDNQAQWSDDMRTNAETGDAVAQLRFGNYYQGISVWPPTGEKPNYKEAAKWYERAANQGVDYAAYHLADLYLHGNGVPQDPSEAYFWALVAIKSDPVKYESVPRCEYKKVRDISAQALSPAQIATAKERVAKWNPVKERGPENK